MVNHISHFLWPVLHSSPSSSHPRCHPTTGWHMWQSVALSACPHMQTKDPSFETSVSDVQTSFSFGDLDVWDLELWRIVFLLGAMIRACSQTLWNRSVWESVEALERVTESQRGRRERVEAKRENESRRECVCEWIKTEKLKKCSIYISEIKPIAP